MAAKLRSWISAALVFAFLSPLPVCAQESQAGKENPPAVGEDQANDGRPITVSGVVTGDYQLKGDDGVIYEIADTVTGNDVVQKVGARVRIQGTVFADGAYRVLVVESYRTDSK